MSKTKIMIVEDETIVALNHQTRLERLGYEVISILQTGEEAVAKVGELGPDIILMDIKLAGKMDGIETAEIITEEYDIPIVYITALSDEKSLMRAKITQPFGFIHKPVDIKEMQTSVEMAIYNHQMVKTIRQSEERFRTLLNNLPHIAVQGLDGDGRIQYWNRASEDIFSIPENEAIGKNVFDLIIPKEHQEKAKSEFRKIADGSCDVGTKERSMLLENGTMISMYSSFVTLSSPGKDPEIFAIGTDLSSFKKAQQALVTSEEKYRTLTDNVNVGVFRTTPGKVGKFIEVNPALVKMFGYDAKQELLRMRVADMYLDPSDREIINTKILENDFVKGEELRLKRRDGTEFIGSVSAVTVKDTFGNPKYYDGIIEDVTALKQSEEERASSLSLLRATLDSTADGILVVDLHGRTVITNEKFVEMWSMPDSILESRDDEKALAFALKQLEFPEQFITKVRYLYEHIEEESVDEVIFKDGRIFERFSKPQRIEDTIVGRVWSFRDVTQARQVKNDLNKERGYFKELFQSAPEAIILADSDGKVVRINSEFTMMFGYTEDDVKGANVDDLITREEGEEWEEAKKITQNSAFGTTNTVETVRYRKDRSQIDVSIIGSPIFINGKTVGVYAIYRDISEQKINEMERERLNQQLEEKNNELQQIVYVTSHDLRSPLVNVQGFTQELDKSYAKIMTLLDDIDLPQEQRKILDTISREEIPEALGYIDSSVLKMDQLIKGLLRISRLGTAILSIEQVNMNEMLNNIKGTFEFQIKSKEAVVAVEDLPDCQGDRTQINQVFSNLLDNALKYLDPQRTGKIKISGVEDANSVLYSVTDNGKGIPKDQIEKVFQLFHRVDNTSVAGEGLGLTAIKRILDRNNGRIWLESNEGVGSTFYVSLPRP